VRFCVSGVRVVAEPGNQEFAKTFSTGPACTDMTRIRCPSVSCLNHSQPFNQQFRSVANTAQQTQRPEQGGGGVSTAAAHRFWLGEPCRITVYTLTVLGQVFVYLIAPLCICTWRLLPFPPSRHPRLCPRSVPPSMHKTTKRDHIPLPTSLPTSTLRRGRAGSAATAGLHRTPAPVMSPISDSPSPTHS
jgi:hypothetical protein